MLVAAFIHTGISFYLDIQDGNNCKYTSVEKNYLTEYLRSMARLCEAFKKGLTPSKWKEPLCRTECKIFFDGVKK